MKFLIDTQLPARLARQLNKAGHDAIHTSALPDGNRTSDTEIARVADEQERVLISKDRDFRDSHLLRGSPRRLLVVATGNITNTELLVMFAQHLDAIVHALAAVTFVELRVGQLIVHDTR